MKKGVDYIKYIKDNPKGYWFKRKLYGWGWVPVRWQGWTFLLIWLGLFIHFLFLFEKSSQSIGDVFNIIVIPLILLIALLFLICYGKGEKPKWSWGK